MTIHEIAATGLKGPGFRHQLTPMTFITGDNGSGKTAITDAIKIALLGRHPVLGATGKSIMDLASGDLLEIDLELSHCGGPPTNLRYRWERKRGSVRTAESPDEQHRPLLAGIIPAALDFDTFAKAKPTERQRILEAAMQEGDDNQSQAIKERIAEMRRRALMAIESATVPWDFLTYQSFEATCAAAKREIGQDVKRLTEALKQSMVDEATELMARDINAINPQDLEAAEQDLAANNREIGAQTARVNAIAEAQMQAPDQPDYARPEPNEIEALKNRIAANQQSLERAREAALHNASINERIRSIDQALRDRPTPVCQPASPCPSNEQIKQAEQAWQEHSRNEYAAAERARAEEEKIRTTKAERDRLGAAGQCPTCGTAGKDLEKAIAEVFGAKIAAAKADMELSKKRREKAAAERDEADRQVKLLTELAALWAAWNSHKECESLEAQRDALAATLLRIPPTDDHHALTRELTDLEYRAAAWKEWDESKATIPTKDATAKAMANLLQTTEHGKAIQQRVAELKSQQADHQNALARVRNQTRYNEELEQAREGEQDLAQAAAWAKEKSLEAAALAMAPILEPANRILDGVIEGKLEINGTDIGIRRVEFYRLETLSGAEAAAVAIAVQTALAGKSTVPVIIADELSRLRHQRKTRLIANLRDAIHRGYISQAILIDHDPKVGAEAGPVEYVIHCETATPTPE